MTRILNVFRATARFVDAAVQSGRAQCDRPRLTRTEVQALFSSELGLNLRRV